MAVDVNASTTPNENAMKFTLTQNAIESGYKTYANPEAAAESPAAKALFAIDGVTQVFLMADFVTVTKKPEVNWSDLQGPVTKSAIRKTWEPFHWADFFATGKSGP